MAREFARKFYKSKAWRLCRAGYLRQQHDICERCGKPGNIVHHIEWLKPSNINDPEITLNWDNLELLCQDCHTNEHLRTSACEKGMMFDANGDIVTSPYKNFD